MSEKGQNQYFIVINLGLRSVRVIVFDDKAQKLWHGWHPVETIVGADQVEQNAEDWWNKAESLLKDAVHNISELKDSELYLSVTGSSSCLIPVDSSGKAIYNSIMVSDKRATKEALKLEERYPHHFAAKDEFLPLASYLMPKILWFKNNEPSLHKKVFKYLSPNDFLIYKLTGRYITDDLNAHKFYFHEKYNIFFDEILSHFNLGKELFPEVVRCGNIVGPTTPDVVSKTGISKNSKVILTTYDALCAFWGTGVAQEGDSSNVVGTVSSLRTLSNKRKKFKSNLLSQEFLLFNKFVVGGSNNLDGGLMEWAKEAFYEDAAKDDSIYKLMEEEATHSTVGARGLLFMPYLLGERAPFWDTEVRGLFFGIEKFHRREDFIRSVYESSAFMITDMLNEIEKSGLQVSNIKLSGGFAKSELGSMLRADVTGKEIHLLAEEESTALGSCLISMFTLNLIDLNGLKDIVKIRKIVTPEKVHHEQYQKLYALFKELYNSTKNLHLLRKDVQSDILSGDERYILKNL
ncbi:MAG TPA: FGGY family carbohydrate kinase [Candidatus Saccharimonadales bacterium]|nr:FGGY family carbohydrate kinase [Candidatus Saccharimonadales bacterium]